MSKTIKLKAAKSVRLQSLDESAIRDLVIKQAELALSELPRELRPAEVNSIMLESNAAEVADTGVWAQWTRACCDKRRRIDDFVNPELPELTTGIGGLEKALGQDHFDSHFAVRATARALKTKRSVKSRAKTAARSRRK